MDIEKTIASKHWPQNLDAFTLGYIEAIGFTEFHCDNEELEHCGATDFAPETRRKILQDCAKFQSDNSELLNAVYEHETDARPEDHCGHDFWLTRCGHGAGFWDRGLGELGDRLSEKCGFRTEFDNINVYLGDNRKVYFS
jgi:hypothetical protein